MVAQPLETPIISNGLEEVQLIPETTLDAEFFATDSVRLFYENPDISLHSYKIVVQCKGGDAEIYYAAHGVLKGASLRFIRMAALPCKIHVQGIKIYFGKDILPLKANYLLNVN